MNRTTNRLTEMRRVIPWLTRSCVACITFAAIAGSLRAQANETPPPELMTPEAGAVLENGNGDGSAQMVWEFTWSEVPGATAYQIYVIHKKARNPMIHRNVESASYRHVGKGYVANHNLEGWTWKVRARIDGQWTPWSEVRDFQVKPLESDPPRN
jgi:hypothetical protein